MADRYWVGGGGTWNNANTANWSAASAISLPGAQILVSPNLITTNFPALVVGMQVFLANNATTLGTIVSGSGNAWVVSGAGTASAQTMTAATVNQSIPGTGDNAFFDANSKGTSTATVNRSSSRVLNDFNVSATGWTFSGTSTTGIEGNLNFTALVTWTNTGTVSFTAATSKTITSTGTSFASALNFNSTSTGTWVLQDNLTSTAGVTHTSGTIDLNGKTLTVGGSYTTATGTKNLTFNGGTLACQAATTTAFNNAQPTGYSTTAGTGTGYISMTAATAKTFVGGGLTFNCTLSQDGAGALTITGANTFFNIRNTVQPATVTFPASTTNIFSNFSLSGTAGNLVTINSSTGGTQATISKSSGVVFRDYLSIQDSAATGGASWYAGANSTNVSGNTGWVFSAPNYVITANNGTYDLTGQTVGIVYSPTPFIVIDTHDGEYHKKKFNDAKAKDKRKKADIIQAYERLVEGKPDVAEEIVAPYIKPPNNKRLEPFINYDKLIADVDRADRLWQAYIDMDDEEVLMLL